MDEKEQRKQTGTKDSEQDFSHRNEGGEEPSGFTPQNPGSTWKAILDIKNHPLHRREP